MSAVPHSVATRLYQPRRAILSVLNRCLTGKDTSFDRARLLESEEHAMFRTRRERSKGHVCSGNQEVNVSSKPKKDDVPRKKRTITYADNLLEIENKAILLAKSVSTEEQRCQQQGIVA
ncbi:hypothetical protein Tco_0930668 [Tanacetum coccineum]